ncbi:CLIP-associating protein [Volvox carteri f. nagariensis]|uniref:CLIP-associating protein n=1 Tax=Volvox carteri f. nagariensis TaxID=3068 RepID=D8TUE9_VOLCA|nr:CLIP-associating protein [Volvox carteri f. nagariensis]EFJ48812.1 CLIP-associating protein [Volvox carteri f. nagariensis]|eukprot:XP_002950144.1 CLIP-associating protein [Volvox carteri f. nagariensis]
MSGSVWNNIKEDLQASSKQRLSGLEGLEALLKRTSLGKTELTELIDLSPSLLSDANSKVALQTLEALETAVSRADAPISSYASSLVPSVAERLGDSRQPVREQALHLLTSLFKALKPELVLEKLAHLWQHKSWKVKQGLLEVIAEVVSTAGASFLGGRDQNNAVLKQIVRMMEEPDMIVREAALGCLGEIHRQAPAAVISTVQASNLRPAQQKEVFARLGIAGTVSDATGTEVGSKHVQGATGTYVSDAGASSSSSGGCYLTPDLTAPVVLDANRGPVGGAASSWAAETRRPGTAAAGPSQATTTAAAKRGGFKDGGGVTLDGELPLATPIPIMSERELRMELEAATATLAQAPNADWQARMSAMQRVEGLVLGGAVDWECFHEAMKGLAQALSQQFKERRSTIARQTCHLIGVLAQALGPRFEPYALTLLPTLFGVLVITVAVMAESADVGVRGILQHCQTGRLLQAISDGVCREKNPKTRQFCACYLTQILGDWDVGVWSRQAELVEAAIRAAAQDSLADTRQSARTAMALYSGAQPDRAQAFLRRLDNSLQEKLAVGLAGAKPVKAATGTSSRQSLTAAIAATKRLARRGTTAADTAGSGILVMVPGGAKAEQAPEPAQKVPEQSANSDSDVRPRPAMRVSNTLVGPNPSTGVPSTSCDAMSAATESATRSLSGTLGRNSRKSLGLPPGRIPGGSADLTALLGESSSTDLTAQARIAALRRPRMSAVPYDLAQRIQLPTGPPVTPALRPGAEMPGAVHYSVAQTPEQAPSRGPVVPGQLTEDEQLEGPRSC